MAFWTNLFKTKTMPEGKPKYKPSERFMDAIQNGDRDEVLRLILRLDDREILKKGLALSKKTRWHTITKDLQDAIIGKKNTTVSNKSISYGNIRPHKSKPIEAAPAPFFLDPIEESLFKLKNKERKNMSNLYLSDEDKKLAQLLEKKESGGLTEDEEVDYIEFMKKICKELSGCSDEVLEKVYGSSKKKKPDKVVLDGETLKRYVRSTCLINDLTYLNLGHNIKLGNGEFPDNKNRWHKTGAVIVPSGEITNFYDYHGTDYRWWVLTSDDSNLIEKELLYIVLDFDLQRPDRALSFFLVHEHDANWARFLVKSDSLVILSGPSKSISNAIIIPIENNFRSHVNLWLSKFG